MFRMNQVFDWTLKIEKSVYNYVNSSLNYLFISYTTLFCEYNNVKLLLLLLLLW